MTEREFIVSEIVFREQRLRSWVNLETESIEMLRARIKEIDRENESTTPTEEEAP